MDNACYNIYRGAGSPQAIDWGKPVASVAAGGDLVELRGLGHAAGTAFYYAVRAVSPQGVEERSTHVLTCVRIDPSGALLAALAAPSELTAHLAGGAVVLGFSYVPPPGHEKAEAFEVFCGRGWPDLSHPAAAVVPASPWQRDFELHLPAPNLPLRLAVRATSARGAGPLSQVICVSAAPLAAVAQL